MLDVKLEAPPRHHLLPDRKPCAPYKNPICWKRKSLLLIETSKLSRTAWGDFNPTPDSGQIESERSWLSGRTSSKDERVFLKVNKIIPAGIAKNPAVTPRTLRPAISQVPTHGRIGAISPIGASIAAHPSTTRGPRKAACAAAGAVEFCRG